MTGAVQSFAAAGAAEEGGRVAEALDLYRQTLAAEPQHSGALLGLARLLLATGELEAARTCLEARLALLPDDAETAFQLGTVHLAGEHYGAAAEHLGRAAALAPGMPEVHNNLGAALLHLGRHDEAIAALERALELRPDFAVALNTLGNAHAEAGRAEPAITAYRRACELDPGLVEAAVNLGHAIREQGRAEEAISWFMKALSARPDSVDAHNGLGLGLQDQHLHGKAIATFRRALEVEPENVEVLNNLAISLQIIGRHAEALALYRDLLSARPELAQAHANLGHVLQGMGRQGEAADAFRRALELNPEARSLHMFLAYALLHECAWDDLGAVMDRVIAEAEAAEGNPLSASPFALAATPASPALRLRVARRSARAVGESVAAEAAALGFLYAKPRGGRLAVGYVSPDFRTHSLGLAFRELLGAHDRERFQWHGYALTSSGEDEVGADYARAFDAFADLSAMTPPEAARRINADGIQVLIDLAGHTRNAGLELFFLKPAPVQAHYLGYAMTLGAECIQYLITDPVHMPPALAPHCAEHLVHLPESFMATARPDVGAVPEGRAGHGLPPEAVVFVSFNTHFKLHPAMFDCWMRLLDQVPGSVLWLRGGAVATANLRRQAEARGVDGDRLVFADRLPHAEHLARLGLADIALDTLYHGGGVTSVDALWCGVPLVTLAGEPPSARIGASLLSALGLEELIATSLEDYQRIALDLARDGERLGALKAKLRRNLESEPLFDVARLARHLERAYELMWERYESGAPPAPIRVPALPRA